MGKDEKPAAAAEANETGESQSKKAAKKLAKEAAKAAKVIYLLVNAFLTPFSDEKNVSNRKNSVNSIYFRN